MTTMNDSLVELRLWPLWLSDHKSFSLHVTPDVSSASVFEVEGSSENKSEYLVSIKYKITLRNLFIRKKITIQSLLHGTFRNVKRTHDRLDNKQRHTNVFEKIVAHKLKTSFSYCNHQEAFEHMRNGKRKKLSEDFFNVINEMPTLSVFSKDDKRVLINKNVIQKVKKLSFSNQCLNKKANSERTGPIDIHTKHCGEICLNTYDKIKKEKTKSFAKLISGSNNKSIEFNPCLKNLLSAADNIIDDFAKVVYENKYPGYVPSFALPNIKPSLTDTSIDKKSERLKETCMLEILPIKTALDEIFHKVSYWNLWNDIKQFENMQNKVDNRICYTNRVVYYFVFNEADEHQ